MRRPMKALMLSLCVVMATPAFADYFVILHTAPDTGRAAEIAAEAVKRELNRKCKVKSETTHTGTGRNPG